MIRRFVRRIIIWSLGSDPDIQAGLAVADKAALKVLIHCAEDRIEAIESGLRRVHGYLAEKAEKPKKGKRHASRS